MDATDRDNVDRELDKLLAATSQAQSTQKIDQQISTLRQQLEDSYQMLVNTRDALSSMSIVGAMEKHRQAEPTDVVSGVNDNIVPDNLTDVRKSLNVPEIVDVVPEIKQLFHTLQELKRKIGEMEVNQKFLSDLNDDVEVAIDEMSQRNDQIKAFCGENGQIDG
jgi:hypothetical protein